MYNYRNDEIYKVIAGELEGVNVVQTVIPRDSSRLATEYELFTFGKVGVRIRNNEKRKIC